jgi:hypothetical protein
VQTLAGVGVLTHEKTCNPNIENCNATPNSALICDTNQLVANYEIDKIPSHTTVASAPPDPVQIEKSQEILSDDLREMMTMWNSLSESARSALLLTARAMSFR